MRGLPRFIFSKDKFLYQEKVVGVEVGVCYGLNALEMLICNENLFLHLVDNYSRNDSFRAKEVSDYILKPLGDRISWHFKSSVEASKDFKDGSLDFVYIDADHSYEAVKQDIDVWLPKVKVGGVLGGHDFYPGKLGDYVEKSPSNNGVKRAVLEYFRGKKKSKLGPVGFDWWVEI